MPAQNWEFCLSIVRRVGIHPGGAFATGDVAPTALVSDKVDLSVTNSREVDEAEERWLTDELLERVFG